MSVNIYQDMENSTNGTTVSGTIATNGSHGTGVTWAVTGTAVKVSTAFEATLRGPVSVSGGSSYDDVGSTRGWTWPHATSGLNYVSATTSSGQSVTVTSFFYRITGVTRSFELTDVYQVGAGLTYSIVQLDTNQTSPRLNIETWNGSTSHSSYITIANDTTYWISHRYNAGTGASSLTVYNASTYTQVGQVTGTSSSTGTTTLHRFGETSAHNNSGAGTHYIDDIIINWTDVTYPFLPDVPPASGPYWVSTTGATAWASARSETPLTGTACASISSMNTNATAGDLVYIRAGTTAAGTGQISLSNDGASGNPLVIEVYQDEVFTIDNRTNAQGPAINLTNRDYVTIRKVRSNNCQESVDLNNCTNIRFESCQFVAHKNTASGWPVAITVANNSQFNVFDSCTIGTCGYDNAGDDAGSCVNIGTADVDTDASRFNYFKNCTIFRGGHDVISDYASFNFFDNCFFYSDEWYGSGPFGSRIFITEENAGGATIPAHGNTTFRDCLFQRAGDPPDDLGVGAMSLRTQRNRVIRCIFVDASNTGANCYGVFAINNRIANCVFVHCGVNTPMTDPNQKGGFGFQDPISGALAGDPTLNAVKNCIFRDNYNNSTIVYSGVTAPQTTTNNWTSGDPLFVDWNAADLDPSNPNAHNFHLTSLSGAINNGGWLTTVSGTGSGTSITVADSYWFTDGDGVAPGDTIQLQGSTTRLTITSVDYSTHTLTVTPSTSWTNGTGVAFPYNGSTPDQGAYETVVATRNIDFSGTLTVNSITIG